MHRFQLTTALHGCKGNTAKPFWRAAGPPFPGFSYSSRYRVAIHAVRGRGDRHCLRLQALVVAEGVGFIPPFPSQRKKRASVQERVGHQRFGEGYESKGRKRWGVDVFPRHACGVVEGSFQKCTAPTGLVALFSLTHPSGFACARLRVG